MEIWRKGILWLNQICRHTVCPHYESSLVKMTAPHSCLAHGIINNCAPQMTKKWNYRKWNRSATRQKLWFVRIKVKFLIVGYNEFIHFGRHLDTRENFWWWNKLSRHRRIKRGPKREKMIATHTHTLAYAQRKRERERKCVFQ